MGEVREREREKEADIAFERVRRCETDRQRGRHSKKEEVASKKTDEKWEKVKRVKERM